MDEYIIVDGYNVINAWPELEKIKQTGLGHARAKLIELLANYAAMRAKRIIVVFDAHQTKGKSRYFKVVDGVQVIYTKSGETADSLIEKLSGELSEENRVYVVTFDWAEQRIILGRGAFRLTPVELQDMLARAQEESRSLYGHSLPEERYLEDRLDENIWLILDKYRRK